MRRSSSYPFIGKLQALGYRSYRGYLRSKHWQAVRETYYASGRPRACYCCGEQQQLHLHHKTYERLGAERLDDLVPLCERCHRLVHTLERRGDVGLDLAGLLDAERAKRYAAVEIPRRDAARTEFQAAHTLEYLPLVARLRLIEERAAAGDAEAKRVLFVVRQRLERFERRQARGIKP